MQRDEFLAATERLSTGAEIPPVAPSHIEAMWEVVSRIPKEQRSGTATGLGAVARVDPSFATLDPEQHVALTTRYALLDGLIELGILDQYLAHESQRKRVFAAAAAIRCNKGDLAEAIAHRYFRGAPAGDAEKAYEEFARAGYDPDHPKIAERLIRWMQDNAV